MPDLLKPVAGFMREMLFRTVVCFRCEHREHVHIFFKSNCKLIFLLITNLYLRGKNRRLANSNRMFYLRLFQTDRRTGNRARARIHTHTHTHIYRASAIGVGMHDSYGPRDGWPGDDVHTVTVHRQGTDAGHAELHSQTEVTSRFK